MDKVFVFKGQSSSYFRDDCKSCIHQNSCVSATGITQSKFEYLLRLKGYRPIETEMMIKGKEMHEEILSSYKSVDEYGIKKLKEDVKDGIEARLREVPVCSKLYGLKGFIDLLRIRYEKKERRLLLDIFEIKQKMTKQYFLQACVYALILSDPDFEVVYERKKRKVKRLGTKIAPKEPHLRSITITISTPSKSYSILWMKDNEILESGHKMRILMEAKRKRSLHKAGIWLACELDKSCKTRQLFLGKRKLLRKTKPVVRM